jgi:hypothetical protein
MPPPTEKFVVIHADDLGLCHGANAAFAELSRLGMCSSGSVMAPCPWFMEIAAMVAANRDLDIGVHLTLTSEMTHYKWRPLTSPPASAGLTDSNGFFFATPAEVRARAHREAVETELRAQIDAALRAGIDVTHLDDHAGTVLAPEFCDIYIRIGLDYRLPILITPTLSTYGGPHNMQGVNAEDYANHANRALAAGLRLFDRIMETPWQRREAADVVYRRLIGEISFGYTFLALHFTKPGEIETIDGAFSFIRTAEYELFRSQAFRDWISRRNLTLIGMRGVRDEFRARLSGIS